MGRKNHLGHEREAARKALVELLNLPNINFRKVDDDKRRAPAFALAQRFVETNGPLRGGDPLWAEAETFEYAQRLRQVWVDAEESRFRAAEATLNEIFKASDPLQKETFGHLEFGADNFPGQIVLAILENWTDMAVCVNPDCPERYFLAKRSTQRYCERGECTKYGLRKKAKKWWSVNRAKQKGGVGHAKGSNRPD